MAPEKTALVLGGGGILGAAEIGFIQRIEELGIGIDMVVGTSVGAINGAYFATHDAPAYRGLRETWLGLRGRTAFPRQPVRVALNLLRRRMSIYDDSFVRGLVMQHITDDDFESARVPLFITATDLASGQRHIFHEGSLLTAILASTAVPGVFPPVRMGDCLFVDGMVSADLDIAAAIELGATTVIAIELRSDIVPGCPRNIIELVSRSVQLLADSRATCSRAGLAHRANVVHVQLGVSLHDRNGFEDAEHLIEQSYAMARSVFAECWDGTALRPGDFHLTIPERVLAPVVERRRHETRRVAPILDLSRVNAPARSHAHRLSQRARSLVAARIAARRAMTG